MCVYVCDYVCACVYVCAIDAYVSVVCVSVCCVFVLFMRTSVCVRLSALCVFICTPLCASLNP